MKATSTTIRIGRQCCGDQAQEQDGVTKMKGEKMPGGKKLILFFGHNINIESFFLSKRVIKGD